MAPAEPSTETLSPRISESPASLADVYESTPHSGGYYHVSATYWPNGTVDVLRLLNSSGGSVIPTITYTPDGEGRVNTVTASSGQNPVTATSYNLFGEPTAVNIGSGSGDADAYTHDPNTGRMTQFKFTVNGTNLTGDLTWNQNGSVKTLGINDGFNAGNTQTCSYLYDGWIRLGTVDCKNGSNVSIWTQAFTMGTDNFGNLSKTGTNGGGSFLPNYNAATNRIISVGGQNYTYDTSGNILNTGTGTGTTAYTWDAEGKTLSVTPFGSSAFTEVYDALGRRVEQGTAGTYIEYVYDPLGDKLGLMNGQAVSRGRVPLPASGVAVYTTNSNVDRYWHADWQGSVRLSTLANRTLYYDAGIAPYGEHYAETGSVTGVFGGIIQDAVVGMYDAPFREYDTASGRWLSPDPAGMAAVDLANPKSLNRYAYVMANPTTLTDPSGLNPTNQDWARLCLQFGNCPQPCDQTVNSGCTGAPVGWDQFDLMNIRVYGGTTWVEGWEVGANQIGTGFLLFGGSFGSPYSGDVSNSSPSTAANNGPVVLQNPCSVQGRALPPSAYAASGQQARNSTTDFALDVAMGWPRGDFLDSQPLASGTKYQNQAYGNYVFGVYFQATGFSLSQSLSAANAYAAYSKVFNWKQYSGNQMDPNYSFLPAASVANIRNGWNAQANGTVCHN
jgi:RHS repeat-associated protein